MLAFTRRLFEMVTHSSFSDLSDQFISYKRGNICAAPMFLMLMTEVLRSPMSPAALVSLATSVPPHVFLQEDVLTAAWDIFGARFPEFERFSSIFSNTGIVKRHGVKPFDWYLERRGLAGTHRGFSRGS
ncbi:hypothetical protein ACVWWO_005251 [Bradyrhizobium sp. F1.13.1]